MIVIHNAPISVAQSFLSQETRCQHGGRGGKGEKSCRWRRDVRKSERGTVGDGKGRKSGWGCAGYRRKEKKVKEESHDDFDGLFIKILQKEEMYPETKLLNLESAPENQHLKYRNRPNNQNRVCSECVAADGTVRNHPEPSGTGNHVPSCLTLLIKSQKYPSVSELVVKEIGAASESVKQRE